MTCTFTNTQRGKIIVKKVTNPASDTTTVFSFTASGGLSPAGFGLKNGEAQTFADVTPNVPSGATYSVTESTIPGGWTLASATCDNGSSVADIKVKIGAGQTVTCTFTNTGRGTIIVKKVTEPGSDTTTVFGFTATGGLSPASFNLSGNLIQECRTNANGGEGISVAGGTQVAPNRLKSHQSNTGLSGSATENGGAEYRLVNYVTNFGGNNRADNAIVPKTTAPAKCAPFPATNITANFPGPITCE